VLDQYKTQITELFHNLENLRTSVGKLTQQVNKNTSNIAENRQAIQGFQDQLGQIQSTIKTHSQQIDDIGKLAMLNQQAIREVKTDYNGLRSIVDSIKASLEMLKSDVEGRLGNVERAVSSLGLELEELRALYGTQITDVERELRDLNLKVSTIVSRVTNNSGDIIDIKKEIAKLLARMNQPPDRDLTAQELNRIVSMLERTGLVNYTAPRRVVTYEVNTPVPNSTTTTKEQFQSLINSFSTKAQEAGENRITPPDIETIYGNETLKAFVCRFYYATSGQDKRAVVNEFTNNLKVVINNFNVNVNVGILAVFFGRGRNSDKNLEMYLKVFITLLYGLNDDSVSRAELKEVAGPLLLKLIDELDMQKGHSSKKSNFQFLVDAACSALGTDRATLLNDAPNLRESTGLGPLS
jgi:DNA repair ATPase RecN